LYKTQKTELNQASEADINRQAMNQASEADINRQAMKRGEDIVRNSASPTTNVTVQQVCVTIFPLIEACAL